MSRSYKKTPSCGDKTSKDSKKIANRRIRAKLKEDFDLDIMYNQHKKHTCSYDIKDYWEAGTSFEEFYQYQVFNYYNRPYLSRFKKEPTKQECWKLYSKWYLRK